MMNIQPDDVLRAAREILRCPKCGKGYTKEGIDLVDTVGHKGIFAASCFGSGTSMMTITSLRDIGNRITRRSDNVEKVTVAKITPTDVVGMQKFLERFDGKFDRVIDDKEEQQTLPQEEKKEQREDIR